MKKNIKLVNEKTDGLKVERHRGTWYVVNQTYFKGEKVFLLESEIWGDEAPYIIVDEYNNIVMEDCYELSDLQYIE